MLLLNQDIVNNYTRVLYIINFQMNFCQKHLNHHCLHAHNCRDPTHHPHKTSKQHKNKHKQPQNLTKSHKQINKSCTFAGGYSGKSKLSVNQQDLKGVKECQQTITEMQRVISSCEQTNRKWSHQNKHLYTQIEYYRQQFANLIQNNNLDARNQIKKRLKQTTQMSLRIKSLQLQNTTLSTQNEGLKRFIHDDKINRQQNKCINGDLQDKYNSVHYKLKNVDKEKEELRAELYIKSKDKERSDQKYDLLRKEFNFQSQQFRKEIKDLNRQLEFCQKELNKFKSSHQKDVEISKIDRSSAQKKEELLKGKLNDYQLKNRELTSTIKQLTIRCEQLSQDLKHAKVILEKKTVNTQEYQQLNKQLEEHMVETKTVIKDRYESNNKQNYQQGGSNEHLYQEIATLKQKIIELEHRNTAHFQEVIMNMGASQAFKRLVEQKNTVIKRLMRQKGQIYTKIIYSQK